MRQLLKRISEFDETRDENEKKTFEEFVLGDAGVTPTRAGRYNHNSYPDKIFITM